MVSHASIPHLAAAIETAQSELKDALRAREKAERAVEIKRAVLDALQKLDPDRTVETMAFLVDRGRDAIARGKAPGTLNKKWRAIMHAVVADGNAPLTPEVWATAAGIAGYPMDAKAARDWLRRTIQSEHGYIERVGDAYKVSQIAIDKFDLNAPEEIETAPTEEGAVQS